MDTLAQPNLNDSRDMKQPTITIQLQYLQDRVTTLEDQLQKAIAVAVKKEAYANTLASDLEHIIIQLSRLEIVKSK